MSVNLTEEQVAAVYRVAVGTGLHCNADPDLIHACTAAINRNGDFTEGEQRTAMDRVARRFAQGMP